MAHFSVRQRSPFRKSFMPSRRQTRHLGPRSLATLDPPPLARPHAVVGLRCHVLHAEDLEPRRLERADRRLAAGARPLDEDLDLLEAVLHALAGAGVGGHLSGERRRLARALEARRAGRLPGDDVSVLVRQRHDGVVERRLDVRLADRDVLADATAGATAGRRSPGRRHLLRGLLAAADRLLRALACAGVRLRALAVHGQAAPVADSAVGADLAQTLDRPRALAAEVALDLEVLVDVLAELRDLVVGEVTDLRVRREPEGGGDLPRRGGPDAVDVRQPDLEPLLVRQVHSGDACQPTLLPLSLLVTRIRADDHGRAVPLDDAAPLAHGLDGCSDLHDLSFMRTKPRRTGAVKEVRA